MSRSARVPPLCCMVPAMFAKARDYAKISKKKVKPKSKLFSGKSKKKVNPKIDLQKSKNIYKIEWKVYFLLFSRIYIILIITSDVSPGISFFRILKGGAGEKFTFFTFLLFMIEKVKKWKPSFKYAAIFYFFYF